MANWPLIASALSVAVFVFTSSGSLSQGTVSGENQDSKNVLFYPRLACSDEFKQQDLETVELSIGVGTEIATQGNYAVLPLSTSPIVETDVLVELCSLKADTIETLLGHFPDTQLLILLGGCLDVSQCWISLSAFTLPDGPNHQSSIFTGELAIGERVGMISDNAAAILEGLGKD